MAQVAMSNKVQKPVIGITLDLAQNSEKYRYASFPWYALRQNYADSVVKAGGVPLMIPYSEDYDRILDLIDGLIIPGGDEDINPAMYGQEITSNRVKPNDARGTFEFKLLQKALERDMPFLGICNGMQLLNVVLGGTLIQDIPDYFASRHEDGVILPIHRLNQANGFQSEAAETYMKYVRKDESCKIRLDHLKMGIGIINHEQPAPKHIPSHIITIKPNTILAELAAGDTEFMVNSTHHQAVGKLGDGLIASAIAPDGIIEAIESTKHKFAVGVEWHPEYLLSGLDLKLFTMLVSYTKS